MSWVPWRRRRERSSITGATGGAPDRRSQLAVGGGPLRRLAGLLAALWPGSGRMGAGLRLVAGSATVGGLVGLRLRRWSLGDVRQQ